jgi:hypothetical protein
MAFNSKEFSYSDINVTVLGRNITGLRGIKYTVKTNKERVYGRGKKALAIQSGNEEIEGEIMLLQSELNALIVAAKAANTANKVTDISFDIVVSYGQGTTAKTDIIIGAEISDYERGMKQGDPFMEISLPFIALEIKEQA